MRARISLLARIAMPGACLLVASPALAASVALGGHDLGAASASSPRCTAAGLTVFQNLSGSTVISVTVGSLPAACAGATIQAAVWNGTTSGKGSATVPGGGGSVTVTLDTAPALTVAEQTDVVITGP